MRIEGLLARPNPCYPLMNKPAVPALQRETLRPRQTQSRVPMTGLRPALCPQDWGVREPARVTPPLPWALPHRPQRF